MRSRALSALVISRRSTSRISDGFGPTRLRPLNTGNAGVRRGRGADPHGSETTSALTTAVGLDHIEAGEYVYGVSQLDMSDDDAPGWCCRCVSSSCRHLIPIQG